VRVLWVDIDHVTVEEARARFERAGVPEPSVLVNSGNGVHAYWLLDEPYLIDDAGEPPPVLTEWVPAADGKNKPRHYFVENGDRVYLDSRKHASRLSPKAERIQDILAGLARAVGGDHTHDLARLLRIAGTLNRKNERNGVAPKATELVVCEPTRRYPLARFESLASCSPAAERSKQVAKMPLPAVRRMTPAKCDKLEERVAACAIAGVGNRSEADFALCCFAVRNGIDRAVVWDRVATIGKFAEQGERYFATTWENAEFDVRAGTFEKLRKRPPAPGMPGPESHSPESPDRPEQPPGTGGEAMPDFGDFGNAGSAGNGAGERPRIEIDAAITPLSETLCEVTTHLLRGGNCFSRADQLVRVHGEEIQPILTNAELSGLINQYVELYFVDSRGVAYRPLPPNYGNTWLNHARERGRLPRIALFTRNSVYTDDWRVLPPGYDAASGYYYAGAAIEPLAGTRHLDALLIDFCFRGDADRANYLGMLLTVVLMPRFIGSKPAVIFNGNQPILGKSMLAQIISLLRDGRHAETASYIKDEIEFEKQLGARVQRGYSTIIIDNAKAKGHDRIIESGCLERSITDAIVSFRLLGHSQTIRAENSFIFCITANAPQVGHDLVTRSAVVNLYYEGNPARRTFAIADPEGYALAHRGEILGELLGMVEAWKAAGQPLARVPNRFNKKGWGETVGGILATAGRPGFMSNAAEAAATLDETRVAFEELVGILAEEAEGHWTPGQLVDLCRRRGLLADEIGFGSARSQVTRMGNLVGRFVDERFRHGDLTLRFERIPDRKGSVYRVRIVPGEHGATTGN
jgi:hypothetical protein